MAREIPEAVRAAAGLAATVLDEARKLPGSLPVLPVRLIGLAMQTSLRLQQQYSGLVARGDEVFTGLRGASEPGLATFDEDEPPPASRPSARNSAFDRAAEPADDLGEDSLDDLADDLDEDLTDDDLSVELSDEIDDAPLADVLAFDALAGSGAAVSDAEVAGLPADPEADALTGVVDELAEEVDAELAAELPGSVSDEVVDDLAADTVAAVATAVGNETVAGSAPAGSGAEPIAGYDSFTIPALRGRLRTYDRALVQSLLEYEQATQARAPFLTLLQNRLDKLAATAAS